MPCPGGVASPGGGPQNIEWCPATGLMAKGEGGDPGAPLAVAKPPAPGDRRPRALLATKRVPREMAPGALGMQSREGAAAGTKRTWGGSIDHPGGAPSLRMGGWHHTAPPEQGRALLASLPHTQSSVCPKTLAAVLPEPPAPSSPPPGTAPHSQPGVPPGNVPPFPLQGEFKQTSSFLV